MDRIQILRSGIKSGSQGIEIGPWHSPIVPKSDGFNTLIVDTFDQKTLLEKAKARGFTKEKLDQIEYVDFVGDASNLLELLRGQGFAGQVDWIISSGNFEHLPNPLKFLQDCSQLIRQGGVLTMSIPDKRFCFDRFHPPATTSGIIQAALQPNLPKRDAWAEFNQATLRSEMYNDDGSASLAWSLESNVPMKLRMRGEGVREHFAKLIKNLQCSIEPEFYGHRWRYTPAFFRLIILDLNVLGLLELAVNKLWNTVGYNFAVQLHHGSINNLPEDEYRSMRLELLLQAEDELAVVSTAYLKLQQKLTERDT